MRLGHISAIVLSGVLWLVIGLLLLTKGIGLTFQCMNTADVTSLPLLNYLVGLTKNLESGIKYLVIMAIMIGYLKARVALSKTVGRNVRRLLLIPAPIKLTNFFTIGYLFLIGFMALLGMGFRFIPIPKDIKALIDMSVGIALINGFLFYLKYAFALKKQKIKK